MKRRIYTDEIIGRIRLMLQQGLKTREIAHAIGTTSKRLTPRMSQLGIQRPNLGVREQSRMVRMPLWVVHAFAEPARKREVTPQQLIRRVVSHVARENLFSAILDDE